MNRLSIYAAILVLLPVSNVHAQEQRIDLSGKWEFKLDAVDSWSAIVTLPGSMTTNNKGSEVTVETPWTGSIVDSSWFLAPQYASYRQPGNIKVPFWLQPVKYYKGAAWYRKEVVVPASW